MNISYNWLKKYLKTDISIEELTNTLTDIGLEVSNTKQIGNNNLTGVVVARVLSCVQHPNADKLKLTNVDIGKENTLQIVCGAPNVAAGKNVPLATIGTVLTTPNGEEFKIKKSKIRGEESYGMICSETELGIGDDDAGILLLDDDLKAGTPIADIYQPQTDYLIEIDLTPNRADAMSHFGVARDLYAALKTKNIPAEFISYDITEFKTTEDENPIQITVEDPKLAPRYLGVSLNNITVQPSPEWMQKQLQTIGIQPKNIVVDVTNYIMHDLGQPLHAFDTDKIIGNQVIVKTLAQDTEFITLDGKARKLNAQDLMICNAKSPMCIAGVLGGLESGVNENTNSVFLESAFFNPVTVRKSAKRHTINTDASFRFERQIDPNLCLDALKQAALLLVEYAGAEIVGEIQDIYPNPIQHRVLDFRLHELDRISGQKIHREQIKKILEHLEIQVLSEHNSVLQLQIPPYRADVEREIDVIEEILRIYGYNNISLPEKFSFTLPKQLNNKAQQQLEKTFNLLVANGFYEVINNSLHKSEYNQAINQNTKQEVKILNPLSADLSAMRQSLLPKMLENVQYNANRNQTNIKLFEFGKTYHQLSPERFSEQNQLAFIVSGNKAEESWTQKTENSNFFLIKSYLVQILELLGIGIEEEKPIQNDANFSNAIAITTQGKNIAKLGEVSELMLNLTQVNQTVFYAEINWDTIAELSKNNQIKFKELPKYPGSKRDLAFTLNQDVLYQDLYHAAFNTEKNLIKSIQLFDVYQGNKLPEGKKSYALSFYLQNDNQTITDKEIDKVMSKLITAFEQKFSAQLRN